LLSLGVNEHILKVPSRQIVRLRPAPHIEAHNCQMMNHT
jgi:hypothetical protein